MKVIIDTEELQRLATGAQNAAEALNAINLDLGHAWQRAVQPRPELAAIGARTTQLGGELVVLTAIAYSDRATLKVEAAAVVLAEGGFPLRGLSADARAAFHELVVSTSDDLSQTWFDFSGELRGEAQRVAWWPTPVAILGATSLAASGWLSRHGLNQARVTASSVTGIIGLARLLSAGSSVAGRYTNEWRKVVNVLGDIAKYKRSPVLQALHDSSVTQGVAKLDKFVGPVAKIGTLLDLGENAAALNRDLATGDIGGAAGDVADATAIGLKQSHNPVLYLAGVNVSIWTDVIREASAIDWSESLPNPLTPGNWSTIYAPALSDSAKDVFGHRLFRYL